MKNFFLAWLQVTLISLNTWQIANGKILGALIVGFSISLVWTFNIEHITKSTLTMKIIYAAGASCGTATGLLLAAKIY